MRYKPRFGTRYRDDLWSRECMFAWQAGRGRQPICNLCDIPIRPDEPWDESHAPEQARVFGGRSVGCAHSSCNRLHGVQVVKPQVAKCDRVRAKHLGHKGPGLGRYPMRAGRRSGFTKTMNHGLRPRLKLAAKLAVMRAKRAIVPTTADTGVQA